MDQARKLRLELERAEAMSVERPAGVPEGVPVYPMTRPPLERLVTERPGTEWVPSEGASLGGMGRDPPVPPVLPQGDRAPEQQLHSRGDSGRPGLLGGLLGGWTRSGPDDHARGRDVSCEGQDPQHGQSSSGNDDVTRLLQGMERLLSNNQRNEVQETVKSASATALPQLPGITESAAVDFGDWLHTIANSMGDLSANSTVWWSAIMQDMATFYEAYVKADQFHRLTMEPKASEEIKHDNWQRVDRRAATMLMGAVDEPIRLELVASRVQSTLAIMCRLAVLY